jgi:ribonucleoside-diphosphate reductase alpha chain
VGGNTVTVATRVEQKQQRPRADVRRDVDTSEDERGFRVERYNTVQGTDPFEMVQWEHRDALITGEEGKVVFHQKDVEVPRSWSQMATNVTASKYFRGHLDTPEREHSVRQLVGRVVDTLQTWAIRGGYLDEDSAQVFRDELAHYLLSQKLAFNSPVWFNMGIEEHAQCSACFINSVTDDMESIMSLAATEARLFKGGSGTGTNLSALRSSCEPLNGGGEASGPVSFMRGYDSFAGVIKSGGKTRRAAKMVILDIDHPDIEEFIRCKSEEEKKAWALIDAGYDGSFNGEAYSSVFFQNSNNSVRITDEFMQAVVDDGEWETLARLDPSKVMATYQARYLWREIARAAWVCGDPGLQFDTTINRWHTSANSGRINASNPCSEFMFLDDSACNLASLNLLKFRRSDGSYDTEQFEHCVATAILAQEIIVGFSRYPTEGIGRNSHLYRPLGIGYANLGALLMAAGMPYDSDEGRSYAATLTALLTGAAYRTSAHIAHHMGTFEGYKDNTAPMMRVMEQHRAALEALDTSSVPSTVRSAARRSWDEAIEYGRRWGYRNAQVSVLAPTGTIGFLMDCDTTGVEPEMALVKYKKLVGGGVMKIVNTTVPEALSGMGYNKAQRAEILKFIDDNDTIEGAPHISPEHVAVFDCAFTPNQGERCIEPKGHLRMMGAVQPFISGAISKTVNMPHDTTVEEIEDTYREAWKLGLKAVAIYRDGCKRTQPLDLGEKDEAPVVEAVVERRPVRERLPNERTAVTHKFSIQGHEGYVTVGMYEDGRPGEIFIVMSKQGSTISGLMDGFATSTSIALQYGVPLATLCEKFSHVRFEPQGFTGNPDIPIAKSITDYIFRWLALKFLPREQRTPTPAEMAVESDESNEGKPEPGTPEAGSIDSLEALAVEAQKHAEDKSNGNGRSSNAQGVEGLVRAADALYARAALDKANAKFQADAPPCPVCGAITVRSGACYKCANCGATTGCS